MRTIPFHRWHSEAPKPGTAAGGTETPDATASSTSHTSLASGGKSPTEVALGQALRPGHTRRTGKPKSRAWPGRAGRKRCATTRVFRKGLPGRAPRSYCLFTEHRLLPTGRKEKTEAFLTVFCSDPKTPAQSVNLCPSSRLQAPSASPSDPACTLMLTTKAARLKGNPASHSQYGRAPPKVQE